VDGGLLRVAKSESKKHHANESQDDSNYRRPSHNGLSSYIVEEPPRIRVPIPIYICGAVLSGCISGFLIVYMAGING
jgi:hypothetical protein